MESKVTTGVSASFTLKLRDVYGNSLVSGGAAVTVTAFSSSVLSLRSAFEPTVVDNRDGTYGISYVIGYAANYSMTVLVNGEAIQSSPFSVEAFWGTPSP